MLLAVAIAFDEAPIALVLVTMFLLGTAEVFADNTAQTLLPMLVPRDDLAIANARIMTGFVTINQLVAPPIGAFLFTIGQAIPFLAQGLVGLLAVALVAKLHLPEHRRAPEEATPVWHDIVEGFRWVWHHAAVRTLVLTILIFNVTFGAAWSVLVLYATEHLGLGSVGFGLITTVSALGGLLGTVCYGWLTRRISLGNLMRIGLIIETITHLVARADHVGVRRAAGVLRLRRARVRLGHHVDHHPAAGGAYRAAGPGRCRQPDGRLRRTGRRRRHRRRPGPALGRDRAVLVRLRRLRGVRRAHLGPAPPHRPRRRTCPRPSPDRERMGSCTSRASTPSTTPPRSARW